MWSWLDWYSTMMVEMERTSVLELSNLLGVAAAAVGDDDDDRIERPRRVAYHQNNVGEDSV